MRQQNLDTNDVTPIEGFGTFWNADKTVGIGNRLQTTPVSIKGDRITSLEIKGERRIFKFGPSPVATPHFFCKSGGNSIERMSISSTHTQYPWQGDLQESHLIAGRPTGQAKYRLAFQ